uniref:KIF-binding protein n=1 Tax=Amphora coffeiformis TaxID=265554 RepID=A0A7S3KV70_9STRA|mmetsp:Transcript_20540/g.38961  ORF Transcript_20540/g.38961 Transcript_20540/m.38961 type:complete len:227 (+) Transcript_20540:165-845(+)|eukprot:scaffold2868_cov171-Amphora_coffeaeformis.AAC.15
MLLLHINGALLEMNEEAIHLLYEGDAEEAISTLLSCLEGAREPFFQNSSSEERTGLSAHLEAIPLGGVLGSEDSIDDYEIEYFGFYRYAFTADKSRVVLSWGNQGWFCFRAAVAFNLALIYHHQGLVNADLPVLSQAVSMYHLGLDFVELAKDLDDSGINNLRLALYNNLGHVYSFLGDGEGVKNCREGLQTELQKTRPDCSTGAFFRRSLTSAREYNVIPWAPVA